MNTQLSNATMKGSLNMSDNNKTTISNVSDINIVTNEPIKSYETLGTNYGLYVAPIYTQKCDERNGAAVCKPKLEGFCFIYNQPGNPMPDKIGQFIIKQTKDDFSTSFINNKNKAGVIDITNTTKFSEDNATRFKYKVISPEKAITLILRGKVLGTIPKINNETGKITVTNSSSTL